MKTMADTRRAIVLIVMALTCCAVLALVGCGSSSNGDTTSQEGATMSDTDGSSAYNLVTPEDAKTLIDDGTVILVDVRTPDEYAAGHIPGAINIPNEGISTTQPQELPDLSAPVMVYCRTGVRSKQAADKLVAMGYQHVYDLSGGITNWPYDTTTE